MSTKTFDRIMARIDAARDNMPAPEESEFDEAARKGLITMDTFTLTITLGNDAMQNGTDVARLLRELAKRIDGNQLDRVDGGKCRDANGNTVAQWEVR